MFSLCLAGYLKKSDPSHPICPAGSQTTPEVKACIIQFDVTCFLLSRFVLLHNRIEIRGSSSVEIEEVNL